VRLPAKKMPVPISALNKNSFPLGELDAFATISMVAGAASTITAKKICDDRTAYGERKKSSTSCVIVVTPNNICGAFYEAEQNVALSSFFIMIHASSI